MHNDNRPNDNPPADRLLTTEDIAEITRAPLSTVRYWRHIGTGPASFRLGRRVVYRTSDVMSWLEQQRQADSLRSTR